MIRTIDNWLDFTLKLKMAFAAALLSMNSVTWVLRVLVVTCARAASMALISASNDDAAGRQSNWSCQASFWKTAKAKAAL